MPQKLPDYLNDIRKRLSDMGNAVKQYQAESTPRLNYQDIKARTLSQNATTSPMAGNSGFTAPQQGNPPPPPPPPPPPDESKFKDILDALRVGGHQVGQSVEDYAKTVLPIWANKNVTPQTLEPARPVTPEVTFQAPEMTRQMRAATLPGQVSPEFAKPTGTVVESKRPPMNLMTQQEADVAFKNPERAANRQQAVKAYQSNKQQLVDYFEGNPELRPREEYNVSFSEGIKDPKLAKDPGFWAYVMARNAAPTIASLGAGAVGTVLGGPAGGIAAAAAMALPLSSTELFDTLIEAGATPEKASEIAVPVGVVLAGLEAAGELPILNRIAPSVGKQFAKGVAKGLGQKLLSIGKAMTEEELSEIITENLQQIVSNAAENAVTGNTPLTKGLKETTLETAVSTLPFAGIGGGLEVTGGIPKSVQENVQKGVQRFATEEAGYIGKGELVQQVTKAAAEAQDNIEVAQDYAQRYTGGDLSSVIGDIKSNLQNVREELGNRMMPYHGGTGNIFPEYHKTALEAMDKVYTKFLEQQGETVPNSANTLQTAPGEPEAGLQTGMFGEDKVVRPEGKSKLTQISMDDQLKLEQARQQTQPEIPTQPPIQPPTPPQQPPSQPPTPPIGRQPSQPMQPSQPRRRAIDDVIAQATEQVRQNRPGTATQLAQRIPGIKQALQYERPGLKMTGENEKFNIAAVAGQSAIGKVAAQIFSSQRPVINELKTQFGNDVVLGKKSAIKFLGTPEQASNPLVGTMLDIAQRAYLYDLTPAQRQVISNLQKHNETGRLIPVNEYGAEIGQYPVGEGSAFLSNVDISEDVMTALDNESRAIATGRSKTRVWDTAADRIVHDKTFKPELNVEKLISGMDSFKAAAAGGQTFRQVVGGLTRLEVLKETHPNLYKQMTGLRQKLTNLQSNLRSVKQDTAEAIDVFMSSPVEDVDLGNLQSELDVRIQKGQFAGMDAAALQDEMDSVRQEIKKLRPMWESANTKPYVFVQEGLYRYFKGDQANLIKELQKTSKNPMLNLIEQVKNTAFSGDFSPIFGVQTPLGVLADPVGSMQFFVSELGKTGKEGNLLRSFSLDTLASDIRKDEQGWSEFFSLIGRAPQGVPTEYAGGFLSKIPGFTKANEGLYIFVTRQMKSLYDRQVSSLKRSGLTDIQAKAASAATATEIFPLFNSKLAGQSQARNNILRTLPTSYSFIRQPINLMTDATKGFAKLVTGQKLSPKESLSVKLAVNLAASTLIASATSAALSAKAKGKSDEEMWKDVLAAINPNPYNSNFASLVIGDIKIPIGGPYRALFRAIWPKEVKGVPFPVPFAGMWDYFGNRLSPVIRTQFDLLANKDYSGKQIIKGELPERILRGLAYEAENVLPLTAGSVVEGVRTGKTPGEMGQEAISQFAGVNTSKVVSQSEKIGMDKLGKVDEEAKKKAITDAQKSGASAARIAELNKKDYTYTTGDLGSQIRTKTAYLPANEYKNYPQAVQFYWDYQEERERYTSLSADERIAYNKQNPDFVLSRLFWGELTSASSSQKAALLQLAQQYGVPPTAIPAFRKATKTAVGVAASRPRIQAPQLRSTTGKKRLNYQAIKASMTGR